VGWKSRSVQRFLLGTHSFTGFEMEGLFRSNDKNDIDKYWGSVWERDGENVYWRNVVMECNIGPYKEGDVISCASYDTIKHEITLSTQDEEGEEIGFYRCYLKVTYTPLLLARTD